MFILVTGGSGSGKSEFAENRAFQLENAPGAERSEVPLCSPYP